MRFFALASQATGPNAESMKTFQHPIQTLSRGKRAALFMASFVLGFVLWYALAQLDKPLETPEAHWGIVSLEVSGTVESSQQIVNSWNVTAREYAQSGLLLDFIFPVCYSTVMTIACFWAASLFRERGFRKAGWVATGIAWLQWPAAVCDYVENIAMWMQLRGPIQDPWPGIARDSALIKFALIAAGLCVVVAAAAIFLLRRRANVPAAPAMLQPLQPTVSAPPRVDSGTRPVP
jgi:hypothetical protein